MAARAPTPSVPQPSADPAVSAAAPAWTAAPQPFAWMRNGVPLVSGIALFEAIALGAPAGAAGARFSARIGALQVDDAPLELFLQATARDAATAAPHVARALQLNGWDLACTPQVASMLLAAEEPASADATATVQLAGLVLTAAPAQLRALLRRPAHPGGAAFEGLINGRPLACTQADFAGLLGPVARRLPGGAQLTVRLEGSVLQGPVALVRELVALPPRGA
jgi:hypothetical protein